MVARFCVILFLFIKLIFWYLVLLFTPKKSKSILLMPCFDEFGGTRTYFFYLVEFLSKKGYSIVAMLKKNQCDQDVMALQAQYPFTIEEINFELYKSSFAGTVFYKKNQEDFIYQLKELLYFWKYVRKYRCATVVSSVDNPELLVFLFLTPVKVFYILHTIATQPLDDLKKKVLNWSLSKKKKVITVSNSAKEHLLVNWTKGLHREFITVVYNYYQPGLKNIEAGTASVKKIVTIGTVAHYKNPFFWITVCKEVLLKYPKDAIEFLWAGDGELLTACAALVKDIPQIKFIGYQKNTEQLYVDCTIYFQPSILESHGIAVLGAMFFEKPCVVSNRQGLPESVINNVTGVVVPVENPHDAANAILLLLNDPGKAHEFGRAGKVRVEANFSKHKWEDEMNALFKLTANKK